MKTKRPSVIQYALALLVVLTMPHIALADDSYQSYKVESSPRPVPGLDGEWITERPFFHPNAWGWGFRISGDIGILTMSYRPNDPRKKVGDVVLKITSRSPTIFRGYQMCYYENSYPPSAFIPVTGELLPDGRLRMRFSGRCNPTNWTMVRKQNVIEVADRNNTGIAKKPLALNLFIGDGQGNLGTVDVATRSVHVIGNMGHAMTDIAFDPVGNLYGITETDLYSIDRNTGISTWIGSLGINDANALVFASDGTLYAAGFAGIQLYAINKSTGQAKAIGTIGPGFRSSGDMAFNGGNLYLSAIGDQLVKIDLTNLFNSRAIGNMGFHDVLGLATGDDGVLYGNAGTQIFSIDTATGAGTLIYDYRGQGLANTNGSTGTPSLESAPLINEQAENLASQCTAPNANISKHLYIPGLDCRQLWEYYLYYRYKISTFQAAGNLISLTEKRALQVYEFVDNINLILGAYHGFASSGAEMKIFNAVWESSGLALNLVPLGEAGGAKLAIDIINYMRDSLAASANYLITEPTTSADLPYAAIVELANRFGALWNIQFKVLAERNAILLADEYLTLHYRNGSDVAKVAAVYGLPSSATTEDVMKRIAKQLGMGRLDYSLKKASQWVSSFKVAISNAANICLQGSTCTGSQASPSSAISAQKLIKETLNKQSDKLKTDKTIPTTPSSASCPYPDETRANSQLIQAALGNVAEQCVTFPYLARYSDLSWEKPMPRYHAGVDLRANYQTAYAVVNGTVMVDCGRGQKNEDTACTDSMGIVMIETELDSIKARVSYVHMSESSKTKGMRVDAGDPIGKTGNRFNFKPNGAGEPHLHIEVRPGYTDTSAVGLSSCRSGDCDTEAKVRAITVDPIRLMQYSATPWGLPMLPVINENNKLKTNKTIPTTNSKAPKDTRTGCNKGSSVTSSSIGGAQGALNKFGVGTDGCTQ